MFRFRPSLFVLLIGIWLLSVPLNAASRASPALDTTADLVIGQPDFNTNAQNTGGVSAASLALPQAAAPDALGNLYVADTSNNRLLVYTAPLANGAAASKVFGQPGFGANNQNNGGLSAGSLLLPQGLALDGVRVGPPARLFIADSGNRRVLMYNDPLTADTSADRVFGQPGFTSNTANHGGVSESSLGLPSGVAIDSAGTLYIADSDNHRVLAYYNPAGPDAAQAVKADRVFGQPDFSANLVNNGGPGPASLYAPQGVAVDRLGSLYIADTMNHRVLVYTAPITDTRADLVIGQSTFSATLANQGGAPSAGSLYYPFSLAVDNAGTLYVADYGNHRILAYTAPLTSDTQADFVFGQPGFTTGAPNQAGLNADGLYSPIRLSLDRSGSLYVADMNNSRVLKYDLPPVYLQLYLHFLPALLR